MRPFRWDRSVEDETRNAELNANRNPEWWGDFSQLVKIEKIRFLGISRYKVEVRFWLDLNSKISCGTNSNWDFCWIWICSCQNLPTIQDFDYHLIQHFESHLPRNGLRSYPLCGRLSPHRYQHPRVARYDGCLSSLVRAQPHANQHS